MVAVRQARRDFDADSRPKSNSRFADNNPLHNGGGGGGGGAGFRPVKVKLANANQGQSTVTLNTPSSSTA